MVVAASPKIHVYPGDSIQAAVDTASEWDTIIVHAGTYNEMVIISTNNITLQGDGAILDGSPFPRDRTKAMVMILDNIQGVTVKGFEVLGFNLSSFRLGNGANNNVIKDNIVSNGRSGLGIFGSHDNTIKNNIVSGVFLSCIYLTGGASGNLIKGNVFIGGSNTVRINGAHHNTILGNDISNGGDGVSVEISNDNIIKENKISNCGENGIFLLGSANNTIIENEVTFSAWNGIHLRGVINPGGYPPGLYISVNNLIKENTVFNSGDVDLYWDQGGPGNFWVENTYGTSDPSPLP
jgi:parallel beta-helix repeat protein